MRQIINKNIIVASALNDGYPLQLATGSSPTDDYEFTPGKSIPEEEEEAEEED